MAVALMFAQEPGVKPVKRTLLHDLEGYYYVILTLAFMFNQPYALKPVPEFHLAMMRSQAVWLHQWLQNTWPVDLQIWQEATDKQKFSALMRGSKRLSICWESNGMSSLSMTCCRR